MCKTKKKKKNPTHRHQPLCTSVLDQCYLSSSFVTIIRDWRLSYLFSQVFPICMGGGNVWFAFLWCGRMEEENGPCHLQYQGGCMVLTLSKAAPRPSPARPNTSKQFVTHFLWEAAWLQEPWFTKSEPRGGWLINAQQLQLSEARDAWQGWDGRRMPCEAQSPPKEPLRLSALALFSFFSLWSKYSSHVLWSTREREAWWVTAQHEGATGEFSCLLLTRFYWKSLFFLLLLGKWNSWL